MVAYEHISALISFFVSLGFAHVLVGVAGLIQSPAKVRINAPHALWALVAISCLLDTWLGLFEQRHVTDWSTGVVLLLIAQATVAYLLAALVMPASFILDGVFDLSEFHNAHRRSYILAFMGFVVVDEAVAATFQGDRMNGQWPALLVAFAVFQAPAALALLVRPFWAQVAGPGILVILSVLYWLDAAPSLN